MSSAAEPRRTLLIGAETPVARALNDLAREGVEGCDCRPMRQATAFLAGETSGDPGAWAFLAGLRLLGTPFDGGALYPEATARLAVPLSRLPEGAGLLLSIAPLTELTIAQDSAAARAFRKTRWDTTYDLSWADLVERIRATFPRLPLTVLTPRGAALQSAGVLARFFGPGVADGRFLLRRALTGPGRDALSRIEAEGQGHAIPDLWSRQADRRGPEVSAAVLGLDEVTHDLLQDRFREDVLRIAATHGVETI